MKLKLYIFILLSASLFLFGSYPPVDEKAKRESLINVLMFNLSQGHFLNVEINDSFSEKAFNLYLSRVDFGKKFFTAEDIEKFNKYKYQLDDEIKTANYDFYDQVCSVLKERYAQTEQFTSKLLEKPFDFTVDEDYELDDKKVSYAKDDDELMEYWRKFLKYNVMLNISEKLDEQEKDTVNKSKKELSVIETEAREKVKKTMSELFKRISQMEETDRISVYINAIVNVYDPHTEYFPPADKENFDIAISGSLEGIGATLEEKDGYIRVSRIVPGSPSWKQGQLKAGDLILKVGQGSTEPVDIVGMKLDNAVRLIRGKKGTEVRLTVKKPDGTTVLISIIRDIVIIDETYAKSVILKNSKTNERYGYIKLPQFYADFNKSSGRTCSKDMKKEIEKINSENSKVAGLIIDLRDNGGGSLQDAVDIAGLFFEKGPVVQVKSKYGAPMVLEDTDPSVQYNGPLVILVNVLSASASEILAAAMQDYKRAIVIGGTGTFGKGTVQHFVNLDDFILNESLKPVGSLKITAQKFYRINGGSTQLKGVTPDISINDEFAYTEVGEKDLEFPMPWNQIDKASYKMIIPKYNPMMLKQKSKARTDSDSAFILLNQQAQRMKRLSEDSKVSLNLSKYRIELKADREEAKKYEKINKEIPFISADYLSLDVKDIKSDSSKMGRMDAWIKTIKTDPLLFEATNVISDMK